MHLGRSVPPSHPLAFPCFRSVTPLPLVLLQVEQTQCKVQEMVALAQVEQRRHGVSLGSEEMVAMAGRVAQVMLDIPGSSRLGGDTEQLRFCGGYRRWCEPSHLPPSVWRGV